VRKLGAQRPLDQRFLEPTRRGFDVGRRERAIADNLVEDFSSERRQDLGARLLPVSVCGAYRLLMLCPTHEISDTLRTSRARYIDSPNPLCRTGRVEPAV